LTEPPHPAVEIETAANAAIVPAREQANHRFM
jgi:hypothetical protein